MPVFPGCQNVCFWSWCHPTHLIHSGVHLGHTGPFVKVSLPTYSSFRAVLLHRGSETESLFGVTIFWMAWLPIPHLFNDPHSLGFNISAATRLFFYEVSPCSRGFSWPALVFVLAVITLTPALPLVLWQPIKQFFFVVRPQGEIFSPWRLHLNTFNE